MLNTLLCSPKTQFLNTTPTVPIISSLPLSRSKRLDQSIFLNSFSALVFCLLACLFVFKRVSNGTWSHSVSSWSLLASDSSPAVSLWAVTVVPGTQGLVHAQEAFYPLTRLLAAVIEVSSPSVSDSFSFTCLLLGPLVIVKEEHRLRVQFN